MDRILIVFLGLTIIFLSSCSKDKDNDEEILPAGDKDSLMIDILTEVAVDQKTFMEITPIPMQEELFDYAELDTSFQKALDAMESFNNMLQNPAILLGSSAKSTQAISWEKKGCDEVGGITECTWEQHHGDYIYRVVQTISFFSNILETYISGTYDDVFYGELGEEFYLISEWSTTFNELQTNINIYFAPTHEGVTGEIVFSYLYIVGDGYTIYTPWGGSEYILDVLYENIIYTWDGINGHHESISTTMAWEGSVISTLVETWCLNYESLRLTYTSTYNFDEHEGAWCVIDCDGIPIYCSDN
jgi:hypothetical protein